MDYKELGIEEGFGDTSLGRLHYIHKSGRKPALLLLHGIGAVLRTWNRFISSEDFDTYAVDLLGHGSSAKPDIKYGVDVQVRAIKEFVDSKIRGDPVIMGNSYGAWIALEYAREHPVSGIIVEDGAVLNEYDSDMIDGKSREELLKALLTENNNSKGVMQSIIDTYSGMSKSELSEVGLPVLILWGSDDDILDVGEAGELHTLIKGSLLKIIYGAKHVPHFSNAKETAVEVTKFIEGLRDESEGNLQG